MTVHPCANGCQLAQVTARAEVAEKHRDDLVGISQHIRTSAREWRRRTKAAEARAEAAEADLRIANRGGLDLLYAIREAIGWTDKHGLSLLPDECRRLKTAASRNAPIWPGKDYDHSQSGGFDGPTGAD